MIPFPDKRYATVLADPPWRYESHGLKSIKKNGEPASGCDLRLRYPTMTVEEIAALPVASVVENRAHLYLWTTNAFMTQAFTIARAWGFDPKTIITWGKTHQHDPDRPSMKMGYWYRSSTEHCIFGVRGSLRLRGSSASTLFLHPRLPHSVKPASFYEMIEAQSPGPYLELFSREVRIGWDKWGNQVPDSVLPIFGESA